MSAGSALVLLPQLYNRRARAALVLRSLGEACDVRVVFEEVGDGFAERARAVAVDDADLVLAVEERLVQKLVGLVNGLSGRAPDDVEFGPRLFRRVAQVNFRPAPGH